MIKARSEVLYKEVMSLSGVNRWKKTGGFSWIQPSEDLCTREINRGFFPICCYLHKFKILKEGRNSPGVDQPE